MLVLLAADSEFEDATLGISFRGRYAVVTVDDRGTCTSLYLGEGSRLRFRQTELTSVSGATTAASAEIGGGTATVVARAPVDLVLPDGRTIKSRSP